MTKLSHSFFSNLNKSMPLGIIQDLNIAQLEVGSMRNFNYLIIDWMRQRYTVVDPHKGLIQILKKSLVSDFNLESILLTHSHHDHVSGIAEILSLQPLIPIYLGEEELGRLCKLELKPSQLNFLIDQSTIKLGQISVKSHHTPGHSPGEFCFEYAQTEENWTENFLITGDTLFIHDCGRTDFEGGSDDEMYKSLNKIKKLHPQSIILPGHHYAMDCWSRLSEELLTSPPLLCQSSDELKRLV
jgi:hydroxyacylglutathione hydrolase